VIVSQIYVHPTSAGIRATHSSPHQLQTTLTYLITPSGLDDDSPKVPGLARFANLALHFTLPSIAQV
jgi:hypothetical protein